MPCLACGREWMLGARFCAYCGQQAESAQGYSVAAILRMKHLTAEDWKRIADEFKEEHRSWSLTKIGHYLTFNDAWDSYYAGYGAGFEAGINRALGLTREDLEHINEIEREIDFDPETD